MKFQLPIPALFLLLLLLAACSGDNDTLPTAVQPAATPNPAVTSALPATHDISTNQPQQLPPDSTPTLAPSEIESGAVEYGAVISDDDFLPIDQILNEIDNDVCQNAYETKLELEALIEEGEDLAELEAAIEELITELENCPTPTP